MKVTRKDITKREQNYDFEIEKDTGWEIKYVEYESLTKEDKPKEGLRASLLLQERYPNKFPSRMNPEEIGYFNDVVYLDFDDKVSRRYEDMLGFAPALSRWKKLPEETQGEIISALSEEAKTLLNRGLEGYIEPK